MPHAYVLFCFRLLFFGFLSSQRFSSILLSFLVADLAKSLQADRGCEFKAKIRVPRLNGGKMGVLATRSPHRPVPIGLSVAKVGSRQRVAGMRLTDETSNHRQGRFICTGCESIMRLYKRSGSQTTSQSWLQVKQQCCVAHSCIPLLACMFE